MAESPSSRPTKVIDIQNGEGIQVGDNNNIFKDCIVSINNHYNQPPPQTADTVPARDHTAKPYLRQVQVQGKKKTKKNVRPVTAPGRPRDQGPASETLLRDSEGRVLEPGDVVWTGNIVNYYCGIFVGDGMVVTVHIKTREVLKVPLDVEKPFMNIWGIYLLYKKYNSVERVQRATRRVGQVFGGDALDFVCWCYTGKKTVWDVILSIVQK